MRKEAKFKQLQNEINNLATNSEKERITRHKAKMGQTKFERMN